MLVFLFFDNVNETVLFTVFSIVIILFLVIDLGVFNKKAHLVSTKSALLQSIFWVAVSVAFGYAIYLYDGGSQASLEYFSAYLTEYALSVDNVFVILIILRYFMVDQIYHHKKSWQARCLDLELSRPALKNQNNKIQIFLLVLKKKRTHIFLYLESKRNHLPFYFLTYLALILKSVLAF